MFGSQVLEVAIGLVFMYLLLSLICSAIREGIEARLKTRAVDLERGIRELLHDPRGQGLAKALYDHPLVSGLFKGDYDPGKLKNDEMPTKSNLPSYIPSRNFAVALMDIVARGPSPTIATGTDVNASTRVSLGSLRAELGRLQNAPVQRAVLTAIDTANGNLAQAQANIEAWFDSGMDRVSGWYKRRTQKLILLVGLVLTIAVNADTLTVAESLVRDDALRKAVVAEAGVVARNPEAPPASVRARYRDLDSLGFPIGWGPTRPGRVPVPSGPSGVAWAAWALAQEIPAHIPGWLMTALAISLGAPFWFDVLNKIMVIRSTVKPREKSPDAASNGPPRSSPGGVSAPTDPVTPHVHEWAAGNPREGLL